MTFRDLREIVNSVPEELLDVMVPFLVPQGNHPAILTCLKIGKVTDSDLVPKGVIIFCLEGTEDEVEGINEFETSENVVN